MDVQDGRDKKRRWIAFGDCFYGFRLPSLRDCAGMTVGVCGGAVVVVVLGCAVVVLVVFEEGICTSGTAVPLV